MVVLKVLVVKKVKDMDARVRYTKMVIKQEFLGLINEKTVDKITVKEICERAQINRATFYKYYDNPYDLLDKLELELLDHLQAEISGLNTADLTNIFRIILNDILEKRDLYTVLFSENGDALFRKRLFKHCYSDNIAKIRWFFPKLSSSRQEWLYYFLAEGSNGILNRWMINGMKEDVEEVVKFLDILISSVNKASF